MSISLTLYIDNDEDEGGAAGGDEGVTVIDLVDAHRLKEINLDKKAWTGYIKGMQLFNTFY